MAEKSEKLMSFDEFKERVYKNIGMLESIEDESLKLTAEHENYGCFGFFFDGLIGELVRSANKIYRRKMKIDKLEIKADALLANKKIKDLLCEKLDATVVLSIDAAYKITPVLYALALEDETKVPFDSILFAIISRKITKEGVENFCVETSTKVEKEKAGKPKGRKPAGD